jgi:hypothetical protein
VTFSCRTGPTTLTCTFGGTGSVSGSVLGGSPATVTFTSASIPIDPSSSAACPRAARWTARYQTGSAYYVTRS